MASILRQQYTGKDANGKKIRKKSKHWYVDYKAADGTRKRVKGTCPPELGPLGV